MKKWYSILLVLFLSLGILTACGSDGETQEQNISEQEASNNNSFPVTVTDGIGKEVVIEKKPEKVVSLIPSNTEILFELGLGDAVVGVTDYDNYPEEVASIEKIGALEINIEKILSLAPDIVFAHESNMGNLTEGLNILEGAGIACIVINDDMTIEEVYQSIELVGKVTGERERAEATIKEMKEIIQEIQEKTATIKDKKNVMIEISPAPEIYVAAKGTIMDHMLTLVNAENAVGDLAGWPQLDEEAVLERNPDVILTTYGYYMENAVESVLNRDGWQEVSAIKNKHVADVDSDMVTRPGPRLAKGALELAKAIYPDAFK